MNILLIDDNRDFRHLIQNNLQHQVYTASSIETALECSAKIDIILLDFHLEHAESYLGINKLKTHFNALIIAISSDDQRDSKLKMLKAGASDYISKPIDLELLSIKLNNLIVESKYTFGDITLDYDTFLLNDKIKLTKNETLILKLLISSSQIVTKKEILRNLWNYDVFAEENAINMNISRIRKKIKLVSSTVEIKSIRNQGYIIQEQDD